MKNIRQFPQIAGGDASIFEILENSVWGIAHPKEVLTDLVNGNRHSQHSKQGSALRQGLWEGGRVRAANAARLHQVLNPPSEGTQRNATKLADANDTRSSAVKRNASRLASLIGRGNTR